MEATLRLHNRLGDLEAAATALAELGAGGRLDDAQAGEVRLVLEEVFTNIVKYAYRDGRDDHPVHLRLALADGWLELAFSDEGIAFDPFATRHDQLDQPFAERADGLMGIPLIRTLMDECRYERRHGQNHLVLRKRIPQSPGIAGRPN